MSLQTLLSDLRSPGVTRTRIGAAVLALVVFSLAVIAYLGLPLIGLAGQEPAGALKVVSPEQLTQRKTRFAQRNTLGQERITSRWPFYNVPPKVVVKNAGPVPARYGGPALIAMVNGAAWFQDGKRLRPGDAEVDGLEVLEVVAPWHARVRWRGGEFTVTLFEREPVRLTGGLDDLRRGAGAPGSVGGHTPTSTPTGAGAPLATNSAASVRPPQPGSSAATGVVPGASSPMAGTALGNLPNSIALPGGGRFTIPAGGVPGQPQTIVMPDGRTATMMISPVISATPGVTGQQVMIAMPATGTPVTPGQPAQTVQMDVVVEADPAHPPQPGDQPQTEEPDKKDDR